MISRREMLIVGGSMLLSTQLPLIAAGDQPVYAGWANLASARQDFITRNPKPYFRQHASSIKGTGADKEILLWKFFEAVTKSSFVPHAQDIGDCVGQATALGVDALTTIQIGLHKKNEEWKGKCSSEVIYAGSRVEVGGGRIRGDGSNGSWAAEWVRDYGVVLRQKYGDVDLTKYSPQLARSWGRRGAGVPEELEKIAKPHPVKTTTLVESWDQACDAIANGYPVMMCSNVGFSTKADKDGFHRRSGTWYHAMLLWGIDSNSSRQGGCIANSWGPNWRSGPEHRLGTPAGCFWADANVIDGMLKQDDSFALSNYVGYPRQHLDYRLW